VLQKKEKPLLILTDIINERTKVNEREENIITKAPRPICSWKYANNELNYNLRQEYSVYTDRQVWRRLRKERTNEWMNEWQKEWVNYRRNEWINELTNDVSSNSCKVMK